jgi:hypothetical protein
MAKQIAPSAAPVIPPAPAPIDPGRPLVSGIQEQRKTLAPSLTETPKGQNPERDLAARQRAAIEKATGQRQEAEDAAAREAPAPPPKAGKDAASQPSSTTSGKTADSADSASKPPAKAPKETPQETDSQSDTSSAEAAGGKTASERRPRIDLQSYKRWAEENPEQAAEIGKYVYKLPETSDWIGLKNKQRKVRTEIQAERDAAAKQNEAQLAAIKAESEAIQQATSKLSPIADLWIAVAEVIKANPDNPNPPIDFDAADAAFLENSGIDIDTYARLRARRRVGSTPEAAKLRIQNQKLQRELAAKQAPAAEKVAEKTESKEAAPAPDSTTKQRQPQHDWTGEIDAKHKLRQLDGWQLKLDDEMRRFYDADTQDYSEDPEAAADRVLKREIEAMMPEDEEPAPVPRKVAPKNGKTLGERPAPAAKPKPKAAQSAPGIPSAAELTPNNDDPHESKLEKNWGKRKNWALERAMARARGELVEDDHDRH